MAPDLPETRDLFYPDVPRRVPYRDTTAVRLGKDLEADILLLDSGAVHARLDDREWPINATVDAYAASLRLVGDLRDVFAAELVADEQRAIDELEAALLRIDPTAFTAPDGYWRGIIEQLRDERF